MNLRRNAPRRPHPVPRRSGRLAMLLLTATAALIIGGCGYRSRSLYPTDIKNISVPIFANGTYRRNWEFRLTEAVDKDIEEETPYKVTSGRHADSVLTGKIVSIQENILTSRFTTNLPQESEITVVVDFTWKDLRSGRVLVERKSFARASTEVLQLNQRVFDAEQQAVERVARGIVGQLQRPWGNPTDAGPSR